MYFLCVLIGSLRFLLLLLRSADLISSDKLDFGFDTSKKNPYILLIQDDFFCGLKWSIIKTKPSSHPAVVDLFLQVVVSSFYHQKHY